MMNNSYTATSLDKLFVGHKFSILRVEGTSPFLFRLKEMGLTEGTVGTVFAVAPFGGAVCIAFKGYKLILKRRYLKSILVKAVA